MRRLRVRVSSPAQSRKIIGGSGYEWRDAGVSSSAYRCLCSFPRPDRGYLIQERRLHAEWERKRSEQWHRNLRWAGELIATGDDRSVVMGVSALDALDDLKELNGQDQRLVDSILTSIVSHDGHEADNSETNRYAGEDKSMEVNRDGPKRET